jgi:hypothetical protein
MAYGLRFPACNELEHGLKSFRKGKVKKSISKEKVMRHMNGTESLLSTLTKISVPSRDDGTRFIDERRRNEIRRIVDSTVFSPVVNDDFLYVVNASDDGKGNTILISCHIDDVCGENIWVKRVGDGVRGTLDNNASVAALLGAMRENTLPLNTYITFTGDEEDEGRGAEKTMTFLREKKSEIFKRLELVIVADVSAAGWEHDVTLENFSFRNEKLLPVIIHALKKNNVTYGVISPEYSLPDESDIYRRFDLNVFALCLPVHVLCESGNECDLALCENGRIKEHCVKGIETTFRKMQMMQHALSVVCSVIYRLSHTV